MRPSDKLGMVSYRAMIVGEWEVAMGKLVREMEGQSKGWSCWQQLRLVLRGISATVSKGPLATLDSDIKEEALDVFASRNGG